MRDRSPVTSVPSGGKHIKKEKAAVIHRSPSPFSKESVSFMRDLPGFTLDVWRGSTEMRQHFFGKPFDLFINYIYVFFLMNKCQKIKTDHRRIFSIPHMSVWLNPFIFMALLLSFLVYQAASSRTGDSIRAWW